MESKEKGWVIVSEDSNIIYDFTFRRLRSESIRKYCSLWDNRQSAIENAIDEKV